MALVIPRRHVSSIWELTRDEQTAIWERVAKVHEHRIHFGTEDAFNIRINDGLAGGQTLTTPRHLRFRTQLVSKQYGRAHTNRHRPIQVLSWPASAIRGFMARRVLGCRCPFGRLIGVSVSFPGPLLLER
jgi:hypothetical protein